MKIFIPGLVFWGSVLWGSAAFAMSCGQLHAMSKSKKGKAPCVLIEHTIGIQPGSFESTYQCKGVKYVETFLENGPCTVKAKK